MPKFNLTTIERWEHRVYYDAIHGESLAEAFAKVQKYMESEEHEVTDSQPELLYLERAAQDGHKIDIPPEIPSSYPVPELRDDPGLTRRELATVLAALRYWQHDLDHLDDALVLDGGGHFTDHTALNASEIDALCERMNCKPKAPQFSVLTLERVTGDGVPEVLIVPPQSSNVDARSFAIAEGYEMEEHDEAMLHGPFGLPEDVDLDEPDDQCPECARSWGPHYKGPCSH